MSVRGRTLFLRKVCFVATFTRLFEPNKYYFPLLECVTQILHKCLLLSDHITNNILLDWRLHFTYHYDTVTFTWARTRTNGSFRKLVERLCGDFSVDRHQRKGSIRILFVLCIALFRMFLSNTSSILQTLKTSISTGCIMKLCTSKKKKRLTMFTGVGLVSSNEAISDIG
jgi:hypothetical protein